MPDLSRSDLMHPDRRSTPHEHPDTWIKAQASGGGNQCIEMRRNGDSVELRDSKDPHGPMLRFTAPGLAAWLKSSRAGVFDYLVVPPS
jgi:hypothetical protein